VRPIEGPDESGRSSATALLQQTPELSSSGSFSDSAPARFAFEDFRGETVQVYDLI